MIRNPRLRKSYVVVFAYYDIISSVTMPVRSVSLDLKARIPVLYYGQNRSIKSICTILGIKKTLVYDTLRYHRLYSVPYNVAAVAKRHKGRKRKLSRTDLNYITYLINHRPTLYLDELQHEMRWHRGKDVSIQTLLRTLRRLHFSRKGVTARAMEQNDIERSEFWSLIARLLAHPDQLMFTDETSRDLRTAARTMGWSLEGIRCLARKFFVRGQRVSILPVMTMDGIITYDIIPGSVTSDDFLHFLQTKVVRSLLNHFDKLTKWA
jgi:transposase